jgi:hypothetical protein
VSRGNNEGSIYFDSPVGVYRVAVTLPGGRRKKVSAKTRDGKARQTVGWARFCRGQAPAMAERRNKVARYVARIAEVPATPTAGRRALTPERADALLPAWPTTASRGRRPLSIPVPVGETLQVHRRRQLEPRRVAGAAWQDSGLVFTTQASSGPPRPAGWSATTGNR